MSENTLRARFVVTISACFFVLAHSAVSANSAAAESATHYLKKRHDAVEDLLKQKPSDARDKKLTQALNELLDYDELSKRSLSRHWSEKSPKERTEFVNLLKQLVERNYRNNLNDTIDFSIKYESEGDSKDGTVVKTVAKSKKKRRAPPIVIEYTMLEESGKWRVFDVVTDGVSLVRNYRNQFNRIIRKDGWQALIEKMRKKLAENSDF